MRKEQREFERLIVAEGEDEGHLASAILDSIGIKKVDVRPAQGEGDIRPQAFAAIKMPGPPVTRLVIIRDAEDSRERRTQSTRGLLRDLGFPNPKDSLVIAKEAGKVAGFAILPWDQDQGSAEDVCLRAVVSPKALSAFDTVLDGLEADGVFLPKSNVVRQKARTQAYLAGVAKDRVVHRCGLGVRHGHFDLHSPALQPLVTFLRTVFES